jgi:sulfur carrier protein
LLITVNSNAREVPDESTLLMLIEALGFGQNRVAVEVNTDLVVKAAWPAHTLKANDRVEIVSFVGGG